MYSNDAAFARAQRAYDNMMPPDWDGEGVESKDCDAVTQRVVTNALGADEDIDEECTFSDKVDVNYADDKAYWTCPECGTEHVDDAEAEEWEE
jgi:hypothetical protein